MKLIFTPNSDTWNTITIDMNDIDKMVLDEYGIEIFTRDLSNNTKTVTVDALITSEWTITIEE